jgi:hypothetical protein
MSKHAGVHLFTVERTVRVLHYAPQKALVSEWESLCTPQFREALMRGMDECQRLGAKSWIIDMTRDPGVPSQDDQNWIETFNAENAVRKGVVACINIHGASALARMGARRWSKSATDKGLVVYDCATLEEALEIAAQIAAGKAA